MAVQADRRSTASTHPFVDQLVELRRRADPRANRAEVADHYEGLFRAGSIPDPRPDAFLPGALEAFPFRTRVEPAALDAGIDVLVIDYDFEANPGFVIRRIRDELVQIDDGFYLGKVLMRFASGYRRIGFFSLRRP